MTKQGTRSVVVVAMMVLALPVLGADNAGKTEGASSGSAAHGTSAVVEVAAQAKGLPRLVDLGAGRCIPCRKMAPILDDLKKTYAGKMEVQFIDVWKDREAGKPYGIRLIPTQIFYDAAGKELFRHEGFYGKDDILAKWKELGVELNKNPESRSQDPE